MIRVHQRFENVVKTSTTTTYYDPFVLLQMSLLHSVSSTKAEIKALAKKRMYETASIETSQNNRAVLKLSNSNNRHVKLNGRIDQPRSRQRGFGKHGHRRA
jgi:hypothetical protein